MTTKSKIKNQKSKLRNFKIFNFQFSIFNSHTGLTLVEVLVALTILSVGLLGVALMQVTSISGNAFSREMAVATELGQDMLEKLNAQEYTDTALTPGNHPTATDVANGLAVAVDTDGVPCNSSTNIVDERGLQVGPSLYIRTWNVIDNDPVTGMKNITVTVCWKEKGTTARSITITGVKVRT